MEGDDGLVADGSLQLPLHVQSNAAADRRTGSDSIDGLLHLAVTAVAAFDGVGRGRQQGIVQERQGVGQGQVQHVGIEVAVTLAAVMLRADYLQLSRPPGHRVAQIVEHPMGRPKPIRPTSAPGTRASSIIARPSDDLRRGKILDAFGGIGNIASRAIHDHTSKKSFSRRYRPIPGPKVRQSSVTVLQSRKTPPFLKGVLGLHSSPHFGPKQDAPCCHSPAKAGIHAGSWIPALAANDIGVTLDLAVTAEEAWSTAPYASGFPSLRPS